ncbi:hypothetical protein WME89_30430 [Sorangium sp. So ce321]|uniref:hypothetical protein n=1 Tax=Sorangium sp. So ce321 TaxID=3133300 RepID=UPI003F5EA52C
MHARPLARRAAGLAAAAILAAAPRAARADPPPLSGVEEALAGILVITLLPSEIGADVALGPSAEGGARALLAWSFQVPIALSESDAATAPLTNHRVVLAPGLAIGEQLGATPDDRADVTFRMRAGYRGVYHPRGGVFGVLAGAGTTMEFWPLVRPSISPELGVHLGSCCMDFAPMVTLILRGDVWFAGDDALRASAIAGWALY